MRAVGIMAHNDECAVSLGKMGAIDWLVEQCYSPVGAIQHFAGFGLANMALQRNNKTLILEADGVTALTRLMASDSAEAQAAAQDALTALHLGNGDEEGQSQPDKQVGLIHTLDTENLQPPLFYPAAERGRSCPHV
jgi:hypothetical protein